MIKAIETEYNGYRFRSRLEARWAVFFDVLGIKYEYESEGYELGDLGRYLPDFWLPDAKWHVEIKPDNVDVSELKRTRYFGDNPPDGSMGCLILCGQPEIPNYFYRIYPDAPVDINMDNQAIYLAYMATSTYFHFLDEQNSLIEAIKVARSARFEYGQTFVIK